MVRQPGGTSPAAPLSKSSEMIKLVGALLALELDTLELDGLELEGVELLTLEELELEELELLDVEELEGAGSGEPHADKRISIELASVIRAVCAQVGVSICIVCPKASQNRRNRCLFQVAIRLVV